MSLIYKLKRARAIWRLSGFRKLTQFIWSRTWHCVRVLALNIFMNYRFRAGAKLKISLPYCPAKEEINSRPRVLYIDQISDPQSQAIVRGIGQSLAKVSNLASLDYTKLLQDYGAVGVNRVLIQAAQKLQPNVLYIGKCEKILGSTIKKIKERANIYVMHFYGDFRWQVQKWVADIGRYADLTLLYHQEPAFIQAYHNAGVKSINFWWPGVDPKVFYPRLCVKKYDVIFMGSNADLLTDHPVRRQLLESIAQAGIKLDIFGNGWEYLNGKSNITLHHFVDGVEFAQICAAAKISLGISAVNNVRMYNSWRRTLNSMAAGAFHLTHYVPGMEQVFTNKKHLAWFKTIPEALQLIKYYLTNEASRQRIALAGSREVLVRHTWDQRITDLLSFYYVHNSHVGSKPNSNE